MGLGQHTADALRDEGGRAAVEWHEQIVRAQSKRDCTVTTEAQQWQKYPYSFLYEFCDVSQRHTHFPHPEYLAMHNNHHPRSTQPSTLHGMVKWVPTKGRWCSSAGKVTAGLAESNGSLPPGGWLKSPAGWLPVHRDQRRAQRSVTSMGSFCLF